MAAAAPDGPRRDFDLDYAVKMFERDGWTRVKDMSAWLKGEFERVAEKEKRERMERVEATTRTEMERDIKKPLASCPAEPETKKVCWHRDEEHARLEETMGETIKAWRERGKARLGDDHCFVPSFDEIMPPDGYDEGLSPWEKKRLVEFDVFRRIYDSDRELRSLCGRWEERLTCKYIQLEDLHRVVMYKAFKLVYTGPDGRWMKEIEDMSCKADEYLELL